MRMRHRLHLLAPAVLALVACSAPPGASENVSQTGSAITSPDIPANETAFDFFVAKGLTNFQAAGIVGNLDQESQMDPTAAQAGGPGMGIAQWSIGGRWDTDTNDNVLWYAGTQGESATSLTLQLQFIWYELTTFSGYGLGALQASTNVTDATIAFETDFEGCGECDQSNRIAYAETALADYGTFDYAAAYVSQSFPLASTALTMFAGQTIPSYIEMTNTGTVTWDSSTHLGTSNPRDRVSVFADSTWLATNRPSGVSGTVPTGSSYKFTFDLHAPATTGTYLEYFNLVQEGVAWFSDPGEGGPSDTDLEANIVGVAAPDPPLSASAGVKRQFTDPTSLAAWHFSTPDIVPETDALVASYPTGATMPASPNVVIASGAPSVWVIDGSVRRHVINPASMTAWSFTATTWTAAQVDAYAQGPDWPATPFVFQGGGQAAIYLIDSTPPETPEADGGASGGANDDGGTGTASGDDGGAATPGAPGTGSPEQSEDGGATTNGAAASGPGASAGGCATARGATTSAGQSWILCAGAIGLLVRRRSRRVV
jgi:hypothetical protein